MSIVYNKKDFVMYKSAFLNSINRFMLTRRYSKRIISTLLIAVQLFARNK
jgi:hypothetical protein